MSSSGLIYAVIVGAWAAYLVPMWLRRQDELNEARPTERFSTAIRLLSGRAGMERRYAKDRARSADVGEPGFDDPDGVTDSVDVRAFAMPPTRPQTAAQVPGASGRGPSGAAGGAPAGASGHAPSGHAPSGHAPSGHAPSGHAPSGHASSGHAPSGHASSGHAPSSRAAEAPSARGADAPSARAADSAPARGAGSASARRPVPGARRAPGGPAAAARAERAERSKALARRRRTTVLLFVAFTLGAIVAAVGGLAFLWAPGVPAVLLSTYIAYLRSQERRRFAYQMDRRQAEAAAQRLRERARQPRRPAAEPVADDAEEPEEAGEPEEDPGLSALAADRRALVEQTDHAEWVDQQRERQRGPGRGDSWEPVPVPLPTYVTAPVAPRATSDIDLGAPGIWSSARSSTVAGEQETGAAERADELRAEDRADGADGSDGADADDRPAEGDGRGDARRAASARRSRERGRTPLFDQYEDGGRPRAANE
ncbi:gephyrin-like molybdotransferase receptor GlpR [Streptomyces sp. NPDC006458]|uniref:divisome protein SepX/GlpR n=1 Tax=Streptomyces sp. NPDC006458 TaxID=3154302 RepID=UPI0033B39EBF